MSIEEMRRGEGVLIGIYRLYMEYIGQEVCIISLGSAEAQVIIISRVVMQCLVKIR
jgi:hypothetical protein